MWMYDDIVKKALQSICFALYVLHYRPRIIGLALKAPDPTLVNSKRKKFANKTHKHLQN